MKITYKRRKIEVIARNVSGLGRLRGLMMKHGKTSNLLFDFGKPVRYSLHSFFVFFKFLVVWLDENNKVVDFKIAKPFSFYINTDKNFVKILEIPINQKNKKIIKFFVGRRKV